MNRYQINEIVKSTFRKILNEAFKPGESISIGVNDEMLGRRIIRQRYNADPEDFEYIGNGKFVYKAKKRSSSTRKKAPKKEKVFLGRKEGETEQDYLERVRQLNKKFADIENEIPGEEWRPVVNTGRYRSGNTDYTTSHEVSNMGRLRTVDYEDPMRSRISTGYDAPTRKARQFHLDAKTADGEWEKTTPPVHTMVADAWLDAPEGNIEDYDVEHIDGNYHNNRADNLRYVLRKGRRGRKAVPESIRRLTEGDLRRIVKESVQRILKETRLDYDEDNFSGRYSRNADNTIPYQGKLFAFDVDDRGKIYKYGQQPIDVISQCESEAERYGQGHCSVETYESEEDYINAIRNYIKKGYVVTN